MIPSIVVLLCASQFVFSQSFLMQQNPRALLVMDEAGNIVRSIPEVAQYEFSKSSHMLYVSFMRTRSRSKSHIVSYSNSLAVIDPATGHRDRTIEVGQGGRVKLVMSKDGSRLFCYTDQETYDRHGPRIAPAVTVIDTASNQVLETNNALGNLGLLLPKRFGDFFVNLLVNTEGTRMVAVSQVIQNKPNKPPKLITGRISAFKVPSSKASFETDLRGVLRSAALTDDGRFLILETGGGKKNPISLEIVNLDNGTVKKPELTGNFRTTMTSLDSRSLFVAVDKGKKGPTVLDIVDNESGGVTERPLIDRPSKLIRLGSQKAMWVINSKEVRLVSETGELGQKPILLNKPRKKEALDENAESVFLNGYPGETISLGEDHAAMLIDGSNGSTHRLAVLDLKQLQVDSIVRTMTSGEAAKITTRRILIFAALTAAEAAMGAGMGAAAGMNQMQTLNMINSMPMVPLNLRFTNQLLAARPDGKYLYALDMDSHEVTVVDVHAGTALKRIPVDHSVAALQLSANSSHLLCLGKQIQKIDLNSNNLEN